MPSSPARGAVDVAPSLMANYGQVIEYIQDRLYLASYTHAPNAQTPFPYPTRQQTRSPTKRSSKAQQGPVSSSGPKNTPPVYFSVDKNLLYNAFHADFGPLHIGHLYRFAVQLHEILADPANEERGVVFWCMADARSRANAACILACYMVLIQSWPPHLALAPIAQMDPPCMPFRDAGYSQADYVLNIQDVVYGVWKAKEEGLCALKDFNLEEYEKFERVDMGDFNWLTPSFLAFASPQHALPTVDSIPASSSDYAKLPKSLSELQRSQGIPTPFKNVLSHFVSRNVGLVVRLNSELYSPSYFTALGIQHLDMIFDDGTCPPLQLVRKFINLAHEMIQVHKKGIAVHCKAGLGRTGCLIGAYLIYRHAFTANECIAFMRFMRPGMVVGPQQHWLHLNQHTFREWWHEDAMKDKLSMMMPATPTKSSSPNKRLVSNSQTYTPPNGSQKRHALGEISHNDHSPQGRSTSAAFNASKNDSSYTVHEDNLPAPTPGQPRKTSKIYGANSSAVRHRGSENVPLPDTEIVSMTRHTRGESESEEEFQLRMLARRSSRSPAARSPGGNKSDGKRRAVSCTTTTTTTFSESWLDDNMSDVENCKPEDQLVGAMSPTPKTPGREKSGKGESLGVGKTRGSPLRRSTESKVRKTSGRVGSVGNPTVAR
ncbi:phosphatases II [Rhizodiscina lignyota]|uniref:protein-tyrosine-phosphatase n=1 Tax=Rhizodiscina lignyota TaxID=1504668 RepID=A0A9P4M990_9PEZI|nr:phosphatases II [Rhizodiscina lignyota]